MSGISPRRIRSKTAELTEFFRAGNSSSRHPDNDVSTHSQATTYTLDAPSTSSQAAALTKKKSTKIPFLGISRKKSNPAGGDVEGLSVRYSTDVGELPSGTAGTDRRYTMEFPGSRSSTSMAPSTPVKPSLGSKLAAHFQPRTRKLSALGKKPVVESAAASTSNSNTLAVPDQPSRDPSLDSASSTGRSPTPRAQPTITVSLSPENLDEYKDLFTLPRHKKTPNPISAEATPRQSNTPESSEESADSKRTTTSSIPLQGQSGLPRRGSAPAAALESSRRKSSIARHAEQPPKPPPKPPKKSFPVEKARSSQEGSSTPRSSDGKESTGSSLSDKLTTGPPIQRRASVTPTTPAADYSAQQRLRMRQQMQAQTPVPVPEKRNRPPDIPLPSPPGSPQAPSSAPPMSRTSSSSSIPKSRTRPRANTAGSISSIANSPLSQSTLPTTESEASTTPTGTSLEGQQILKTASPDIDLSTATPAQLLVALAARNKQCDELASLVHSLTEKHLAERAALEKKISQLEKEGTKKDNQIKGLMWLVHNNKNPPATDFPSNLDLPPPPSPASTQESPRVASRLRVGRRALHLSDDSGAESSYVTSGAESVRTSETSYSESSSVRRSKGRRPFMLGDSSYAFYRAAVGKRVPPPSSLAPDSALPDVPNNRSSIGSGGSLSASSSASSLLPPSPSVTVSSLSAIPEAPSAYRSSSDQEDRRAIRAAHRMSGSSLASSSTAASSSYVANIKRSRPPSIAQVLENSPNMDNVLDKLRPFQPSS